MRARIRLAVLVVAAAPACFNPTGGATSDDGSTSTGAATSAGTSEPTPMTSLGSTGAAICGDGQVDGDEACDDGIDDDNDACLGTCQEAFCGDRIVCDPCGEQCDDGNDDASDNCHECEYVAFRRVFVSSQRFYATQVFPTDADIQCQALGNKYPGSVFVAWVGSAQFPPRNHVIAPALDLPFVRVDGKVVAADTMDFLDGTLGAPINVDENGTIVAVATDASPCADLELYVWTGANPDGYSSDPDCYGWSTIDEGIEARVGDMTATTPEWSGQPSCYLPCDSQLRIYCVEIVL